MSLQKWQVSGFQSQKWKWETGRRTKMSPVLGGVLAAFPSPVFWCFQCLWHKDWTVTVLGKLPGLILISGWAELVLELGSGRQPHPYPLPWPYLPANISGLVAKVPWAIPWKFYLFLKRVYFLMANLWFFFNSIIYPEHNSTLQDEREAVLNVKYLFTAASSSLRHSAHSASGESLYLHQGTVGTYQCPELSPLLPGC